MFLLKTSVNMKWLQSDEAPDLVHYLAYDSLSPMLLVLQFSLVFLLLIVV